ncbi:hypothetical protein [Tannockella kyphosi]|uniref:hypothetical protein n=1 Tax=Tannockella kyphosi TaxID=2899121 RepID=UPI00201363D7|nr:hypothetical protein [Tannockella kyphosi]
MGQLNLYKIDKLKMEDFLEELESKYAPSDELTISRNIGTGSVTYILSLYISFEQKDNLVEWQWLLNAFGEEDYTNRSNPKSVLVLQSKDVIYACTFGFSFFTVDKYCDTDFAFGFARKHKFKEIKTTR